MSVCVSVCLSACLSVVQLGTHHLSFRAPLLVGSDPEDFVRLLHASYDVQFMEHVAGGRSNRDQNPLAKESEKINHFCQDNNVRADILHNMQVRYYGLSLPLCALQRHAK